MKHEIKIIRDPSDGTGRLVCACGWSLRVDKVDRDEMIKHLDHKPPRPVEPPLKVEGFVSGLPDW